MSSKCGVCEKSVYPMDPQINLDGSLFHTTCAKCEDCKCQITISNFTKSGTTLLCKTHYFKRFKEQGNYLGGEKFSQKSTRGNASYTPSPPPAPSPSQPPATATAAAAAATPPAPEESERRRSIQERMKAFGGGAGNQTKCAVCERTVYPNDPQITLDGVTYHKECAKCSDCNCQITLANFCKFEKTLFCKTHYFKRFKEEGTYLGGEKYAQKSGGAYVTKESSFVPKGPSSSESAVAAPNTDAEVTCEDTAPTQSEVPAHEESVVSSEPAENNEALPAENNEVSPPETTDTPLSENDASPSDATSTEAVSPAETTEQPLEEPPKTAEAEEVHSSAQVETEGV